LKAIIRRQAFASSEKILHGISAALKEFRGERKPEDDITLMVMKMVD
jgi:serine phosphatase RsbU (regulator of sigma subunit)